MPDDFAKQQADHAKKLEGKPTEDCPTCDGSGRRFKSTPAGKEDYGACLVCFGSGRVFAAGVEHTPPENAKPAKPPAPAGDVQPSEPPKLGKVADSTPTT